MPSRTFNEMSDGNVHATHDNVQTRPCDNPECSQRLTWRGGRGRPPLFCSANCRKRALYAAASLLQRIEERHRALAGDLTYRREREIRSELARLEWVLSAYPVSARG
jgi:endogenous inhibitor of DNA gyrase (YacG/DUF329 family)